ncbi:MAG: hypothetical protein ACAI38_08625 [Myxococcota bacterium]
MSVNVVTTPPEGANLPATVEAPAAPRVPISTRVKEKFDAFTATPFGEGLSIWMNKVGSVAGYVVPAAVAAGAAYSIGGVDSVRDTAIVGSIVWGIGGVVSTAIANGGLDNVKQYRKENHPYPRVAAFRDVMSYFILPAAAAGWVAAEYFTGAQAALWLGPAAGAVTASVGIQVLSVRKKRVR